MRTEIHAIAGLGWVFTSIGMKTLVKKLEKETGANIDFHYHQGWDELLDAIRLRWRTLGPAKIGIIGHSWGAWMQQKIATQLALSGIHVEYLACLDATALPIGAAPMRIPVSVSFVREFWATSGVPAGARRRDPYGGKGGMYVYDEGVQHSLHIIPSGHITLPRKSLVFDLIAKDLKVRVLS